MSPSQKQTDVNNKIDVNGKTDVSVKEVNNSTNSAKFSGNLQNKHTFNY